MSGSGGEVRWGEAGSWMFAKQGAWVGGGRAEKGSASARLVSGLAGALREA